MIAKRIYVYGHVQGVGFRRATCREAERLGLLGWVRNRHDGSVEIQAQGETEAIVALEVWSRSGPSHARVEKLDVTPSAPEVLSGFVNGKPDKIITLSDRILPVINSK